MEATTPPNTTGFDRKPNSKKRKFNRKPERKKSGYNPTSAMPSEATAWLYGSMFLMAAARVLGDRYGIRSIYQSQKDCIWILKQNGGGICDHEVGTGKTLIMCIASYFLSEFNEIQPTANSS